MSRFRLVKRSIVVFTTLLPLLLTFARDRRRYIVFGSSRAVSDRRHEARAKKLADTLLELGPTFIKLGQTLSTRPDLIPSVYVRELETLQDEVPPAAWSEVEPIIEADLGAVDEWFDEFDIEPISGASLGQVYRARIDGDPVAVKVRRPRIEERVQVDLRLISLIVPVLTRFVDESRAYSLKNLVDQVDQTIREEMDYEREARMLDRIRANFEADERVVMPEVVDDHSTERVLTMEFIDGTKLTRLDDLDELGVDRKQLASDVRQLYLKMILIDGIFHADPHPGNIAVQPDGTVVLYDFGMSTTISDDRRHDIIDFYVAVASGDPDRIMDSLVEMGTLNPEVVEMAREEMTELIDMRIEDVRGQDVEFYRLQDTIEQLEDTLYEAPFKLPADMALVLRVAMIGEGVCTTLDPEHDIVAVTTDFLAKWGHVAEEEAQRVMDGLQAAD